jgi:hypothetical protein
MFLTDKAKTGKRDLQLFPMMTQSGIEESCIRENSSSCLQNNVFQPEFKVKRESLEEVPCPLESHR